MRSTTPSTRRSRPPGTAITMRPRRRPASSGATASNCSSAHPTKSMTITAWRIPPGIRLSRLRGHQRRRRQRVQGQLRQPDPDGPGIVLRPHQLQLQGALSFRGQPPLRRLLAFRPEEPVECVPVVLRRLARHRRAVHGRSPENALGVQDPGLLRHARQPEHQLLLPRVAAANDQFHLRRQQDLPHRGPEFARQRGHHLGDYLHDRHRFRRYVVEPPFDHRRLLPQEDRRHPDAARHPLLHRTRSALPERRASSPTTAGRFPSATTTAGAISTSACRPTSPTSSTRSWT